MAPDYLQLTGCMEQSLTWEVNRISAIIEIFHLLYNPKVHYFFHRSPPVVSILSQMHPVHIFLHFPQIYSNIIFPSTPRSSELFLPFWFTNQNCPMRATCLAHIFIILIFFYELYNSWSSSLCSLFQSPATSSDLGLNNPLSDLFSNTLNLCSSLSARDQVSHFYKTADKIMVFCILILKFSESRREDKRLMKLYVRH